MLSEGCRILGWCFIGNNLSLEMLDNDFFQRRLKMPRSEDYYSIFRINYSLQFSEVLEVSV